MISSFSTTHHAEPDDETLLLMIKEGDRGAFADLYNKYWERLLLFAVNAIRTQPEAEDIVQDLFISIWKRRESLEINTNLSAYLFTSARYGCIRHIQKNITLNGHLESMARHFSASGHSAFEADMQLKIKELENTFRQGVHALPEKMRRIFLMSRKEQMSYREIATTLQLSEETVKKQVYNALKILRNHAGTIPVYMALRLFPDLF